MKKRKQVAENNACSLIFKWRATIQIVLKETESFLEIQPDFSLKKIITVFTTNLTVWHENLIFISRGELVGIKNSNG